MQGLGPSVWKKAKGAVALMMVMIPEPRVVIRGDQEHPKKGKRPTLPPCCPRFLLQARVRPNGAKLSPCCMRAHYHELALTRLPVCQVRPHQRDDIPTGGDMSRVEGRRVREGPASTSSEEQLEDLGLLSTLERCGRRIVMSPCVTSYRMPNRNEEQKLQGAQCWLNSGKNLKRWGHHPENVGCRGWSQATWTLPICPSAQSVTERIPECRRLNQPTGQPDNTQCHSYGSFLTKTNKQTNK